MLLSLKRPEKYLSPKKRERRFSQTVLGGQDCPFSDEIRL